LTFYIKTVNTNLSCYTNAYHRMN